MSEQIQPRELFVFENDHIIEVIGEAKIKEYKEHGAYTVVTGDEIYEYCCEEDRELGHLRIVK